MVWQLSQFQSERLVPSRTTLVIRRRCQLVRVERIQVLGKKSRNEDQATNVLSQFITDHRYIPSITIISFTALRFMPRKGNFNFNRRLKHHHLNGPNWLKFTARSQLSDWLVSFSESISKQYWTVGKNW